MYKVTASERRTLSRSWAVPRTFTRVQRWIEDAGADTRARREVDDRREPPLQGATELIGIADVALGREGNSVAAAGLTLTA